MTRHLTLVSEPDGTARAFGMTRQLCQHRFVDGKFAARAEVCPTGATLFGQIRRRT